MEVQKMRTLRLMLDQEKKNLENLYASNKQRTPEIIRTEATIKKLQEELAQVCGEVNQHAHYCLCFPRILFESIPVSLVELFFFIIISTNARRKIPVCNMISSNVECVNVTGVGLRKYAV